DMKEKRTPEEISSERYIYTPATDQKRDIYSFEFEPYVQSEFLFPKKENDWDSVRTVLPQHILKNLVGTEGLLASTRESSEIRPNAHREFTIKNFDEKLLERTVTDGAGRAWSLFSFSLFGTITLDTYCTKLPQAVACLTASLKSVRDPLLSTE